jgi:hypothetical protein
MFKSKHDLRDTEKRPIHAAPKEPVEGKLHQRFAPPSFALLPSSVPQLFSHSSTNGKSAPFPAAVM